ncbi:MAG: preprotein translocase subunit YajC [Deltaproteobacteria bacterium CG_4_10_14_3_um_filter_60_8]|nr:MAG: preprotein translocase subunit YajC [Desulfobacterales bacterium CG2_30_60_27]PIP44212.1 MAG: preprotein translocase subunit YajC [Deltaproteobacteria bacterium CG23_combo_of_CG06-09_8_20_14_all_60_8]PIY23355.1 MAG: preprotein translocase subunit YajC [Deltaproteobacteria bacterium CG_4_10_14_3_um_filter_60_8]
MVNIAFAADAGAAAGPQNGFMSFLPLILIFVIFYFLLIRPQQKKAKDHQIFLANLKKGDQVVTSGGLHGEITGLTDTVVTLEIADNLRVKVARPYILGTISAMAAAKETPAKTSGA